MILYEDIQIQRKHENTYSRHTYDLATELKRQKSHLFIYQGSINAVIQERRQ